MHYGIYSWGPPVAMRDVVRACRRDGKAAGFLATDRASVQRAREMGYTMIAAGTDNGLLQQACTQMVGHIDEGRTP
ncbi:MAG: hypothetical protein ABI434_07450 [Burkholderiaceae bacterium]